MSRQQKPYSTVKAMEIDLKHSEPPFLTMVTFCQQPYTLEGKPHEAP